MAPHNVPWLRSGVGATPADGGCILQVIDWIDSEGWTDSPECVHPVLRVLAVRANDGMGDRDRQKLLDLVPRLMGTNSADGVLSVRLAVFCARQVLGLFERRFPDDARPRAAIEAAESWCDKPATDAADAAAAANAANATAAAYAAYAAEAANAVSAYVATNAANAASYAANAANAAHDAANAATYAADAASYAAANAATYTAATYTADAAYSLLLALLDEYDRITDRGQCYSVDLSPVAEMLAHA